MALGILFSTGKEAKGLDSRYCFKVMQFGISLLIKKIEIYVINIMQVHIAQRHNCAKY